MKILDNMLAPRNQIGASVVGGQNHNHHVTHQCFQNYSCFHIPALAEDAVKLSSKVSDTNGRENQNKNEMGVEWETQ